MAPITVIGSELAGVTLAGVPTRLSYPAMPVVVKTPACPTVVAPPPPGEAGGWEEQVTPDGVRALFHNDRGVLTGFALTGLACGEKTRLTALLPPRLAAVGGEPAA